MEEVKNNDILKYMQMEWQKVPKPRLENTYPMSPESSKKLYDINVALLNFLKPYSDDVTMEIVKTDFERSGEKPSFIKDALFFLKDETVDQVRVSCNAQVNEIKSIWLSKKYGEEVERLIDIRLSNISGSIRFSPKREADNFINLLLTKPELWAFCDLLFVASYVKKDLNYFREVTETAMKTHSSNMPTGDNKA